MCISESPCHIRPWIYTRHVKRRFDTHYYTSHVLLFILNIVEYILKLLTTVANLGYHLKSIQVFETLGVRTCSYHLRSMVVCQGPRMTDLSSSAESQSVALWVNPCVFKIYWSSIPVVHLKFRGPSVVWSHLPLK